MELNLQSIVSIIFLITSLASVINHKFFKLPNAIAVMMVSAILSLVFSGLHAMDIVPLAEVGKFVHKMHFQHILLHWMLPILLFAGALHVSYNDLRDYKFQIITFATVGVVISSAIIAWLITLCSGFFHFEITFLQAMVFGVLISSTDPVCVLGILSGGSVSRSLRAKITGESLFNDGTSVVLFLTLVSVAFSSGGINAGISDLNSYNIVLSFLYEVLGGIVVGLGTAWVASFLTRMVDAHDIEIMLTLALAFGSYSIKK